LPLATPVLILGGLALAGGGFDIQDRHAAGMVSWIVVTGLLASPYRKRVRFAKPFVSIASLMLAFSALSALSSAWSSSISTSLIEAERVVAYLGFFAVGFLVCQTSNQRQRFVEGLFLAIAMIVVLAIVVRCFPDLQSATSSEGARLRFPLGYWNANGLFCGIVLFAWMNRAGSHGWLRWLAAALIPLALVTLYLTYSRGGLVASLVMLTGLFFLSRHRLRLAGVLGIGVLASLPTLLVIQNSPAVAQNLAGPDAAAEGRMVALALIGSMTASMLLAHAALRFFSRNPSLSSRALAVSRSGRVLRGVAASGALVLLVLVLVLGGRIWDQFTSDDFYFPDDPKLHFTQLTGAGRYDFNQVAIETFIEDPLTGSGAGTFRFEWAQRRESDLVAQDAHSIYFESFSELGVVGGILVLVLVTSIVLVAVLAWRLSPRDERDRSAMLLSVVLAFVFSLGIDWTWELAASAGLLMLVSACTAAALQDHSLHHRNPGTRNRRAGAGQIAAGLAVSWLALVVLTVPFVADQYMKSSEAAAADGRLKDSMRQARNASRLEPWLPAPHLQMGIIAQSLGFYERSIDEYSRAAELEPENWQPPYLESLAEAARGDLDAASEHLEAALRLNPRSKQVNDLREFLDIAANRDHD
jgi:O-antigen ligase